MAAGVEELIAGASERLSCKGCRRWFFLGSSAGRALSACLDRKHRCGKRGAAESTVAILERDACPARIAHPRIPPVSTRQGVKPFCYVALAIKRSQVSCRRSDACPRANEIHVIAPRGACSCVKVPGRRRALTRVPRPLYCGLAPVGRLRGTCLAKQSGASLVSYLAVVHPLPPTYPTKRPGFSGPHYGGRARIRLYLAFVFVLRLGVTGRRGACVLADFAAFVLFPGTPVSPHAAEKNGPACCTGLSCGW